jgi:hypothetical protein
MWIASGRTAIALLASTCALFVGCSSEPAPSAGAPAATEASPSPANNAPAKPSEASLKDSFAKQLGSIPQTRNSERRGDELFFEGPGLKGAPSAKWRVRIDSVSIEPSGDSRTPYRGVVKSSWYANDQQVLPDMSAKTSNLPVMLTNTGLAQDCWALWDPDVNAWGW